MTGNFTSLVRSAITNSHEEALRLQHPVIGVDYLLLGLLRTGTGAAITLLKHLGCEPEDLKAALEARLEPAPQEAGGNLPLTRRAEQVIKGIYYEAGRFERGSIGTEHLLLSLLQVKDAAAVHVLHDAFGVTYEAAGDALTHLYTTPEFQNEAEFQEMEDPQGGQRPAGQGGEPHQEPRPVSYTPPEVEAVEEGYVQVGLHTLQAGRSRRTGRPEHGVYELVLREVGGERRLGFVTGAIEAQATILELEGIRPPRPMTHDLILRVIERYEGAVEAVRITRREGGTFFSEIGLALEQETRWIDARPSDAIALAVRSGAPLFAAEGLLTG